MPPEMSLLWEVSWIEFVIVTIALGGGGAWMIGRSTAIGWSGWGLLVFYVALLTIAARFIHFSLFGGTFFLPAGTEATAMHYALVDFVILMAIAACGRQFFRTRQRARQYGFLERAGASRS